MELSSSESPFCFPSRRDLDFRAPGLPELAGCGPPLSGHHFSTTCLKLPVVLREKSRNFSDTQIRNPLVELRGSLGTAPYATTARLTGQYLCLCDCRAGQQSRFPSTGKKYLTLWKWGRSPMSLFS